MSNPRSSSKRRTSTRQRRPNAHVSNRQRLSTGGSYHDRVLDEDDFEVVHARESRLGSRRQHLETPRSPQKGKTAWVHGETWMPEDDPELGLDPASDWCDEEYEKDVMAPPRAPAPRVAPKRKVKKSRVSKRPHVVWKEHYRQSYLEEAMRWEGRGDFRGAVSCPDCLSRGPDQPGGADYRCLDCFLPDLVCQKCCVRRHRAQPFHHVERWTGSHFLKIPLKTIGLRIQLNHTSMRCSTPIPAHSNLRVLHNNGIHDVSIDYCGCERLAPKHIQLLRRGLYPANQINPKTCASFELLKQLHLLSLVSKGSTYDFYRMLEKSTNGTGVDLPKSRYRTLLRMVTQWRHLKMLKRGGRGNDSSGVAGTRSGELAVLCPSCPYPGINLPADWADAPPAQQYLYFLIRCIDANFRLSNRLVSSYSADPGLGIGMAYMVPREPYESYLIERLDSTEISSCVGFSALARANTRFSKGLRTTGVGAVSCGRSEMLLPNSVGNLQKGERYANMDFIVGSSLQHSTLLFVILSYDIACQWTANLTERMKTWPDSVKIPAITKTRGVVPMLHEPGHNKKDHEKFSFKYAHGVGLTDGECPERIWAHHNALGNATKTQGPGSRQDVLDDHFGFWNWQKYGGMGATLIRRYKAAVRDRNIQVEGHRGFTATLPSTLVDSWETICVAWDMSPYSKRVRNPYYTKGAHVTEANVQKELAEQEDSRLAAGGTSLHETTPLVFIVLALELEESQRRLRKLAKTKPGESQEASITEQRSTLRTRIRNWEQIRALYVPGISQLLRDDEVRGPGDRNDSKKQPEDLKLWLPSSIPAKRRDAACIPGLAAIEEKLRTAQCGDALEGVRHVLRVKSRMILFKNKNIRGQTYSTRSRSVIDRVHLRAKAHADKYRAARAAKMELSGAGVWEETFRPLLDSDIRSYSDPDKLKQGPGRRGTVEDEQVDQPGQPFHLPIEEDLSLLREHRTRRDGTGETRRTLSWIWLTDAVPDDQTDDDILLSEWAKSRARAARTTEEVQLLREEMRRTLAFLTWRAAWWKERKVLGGVTDPVLAEGIAAYAEDQANLQCRIRTHFQTLWRQPLAEGNDGGDNVAAAGGACAKAPSGIGSDTNAQEPAAAAAADDDDDEDDDDEDTDEGEVMRDVGDDEYDEEANSEDEEWDVDEDEEDNEEGGV